MNQAIFTFFRECLFAIGVMIAFGACGIGLLTSLGNRARFLVFSAPLVGLLVVPFGANAFYVLLGVSYSHAALISAACCLGLTAIYLRRFVADFAPSFSDAFYGGIALLAISSAAVLTIDAATLQTHGPAIFYYDGTDHGGYAHVADWLDAHSIQHPPIESADRPYESWPAYIFATDPRLGAFGLLGILADLRGTSAIFTYNLACAIVISAGTLAVASLFARTTLILGLLAVGLFVSHWFDYAYSGYFGKIIGYPATLFVAGLTLQTMPKTTVETVVALMLITAAMGTMHSGVGSAFLMVPILGASIAANMVWRDHRLVLSNAILLCGVVVASPIIASGLLSRPITNGYPDYHLTWSYIYPRLIDLENQGVTISGISSSWLIAQVSLALAIWAVLLGIAIFTHSTIAVGLLCGPAVLLLLLTVTNAKPLAFQLIGYFYPVVLCGACVILADLPRLSVGVLALVILTVGQRLPRFVGAVDRYVVHQDQRYLFSAAEIDRLVDQIGSQAVEIDVPDPESGILLLVELGRRNLDLQFSDRTWDMLLRYRGWMQPIRPEKAALVLHPIYPVAADHFGLDHRSR